MGQGITWLFASHGFQVFQYIRNDARKIELLEFYQRQERRNRKNRSALNSLDSVVSNIHFKNDLCDLGGCEFVIEAISEDIEQKKNMFSELDKILPANVIFATNTSSLSITEIASATERPENLIGLHFFNPAGVMKLVEIIRGVHTTQALVDVCIHLCERLGKKAVIVEEFPGFIVNRLLMPMINEAVNIFDVGAATARDIDLAMKLGANHPLGPLELADLIGIDVVYAILGTLYKETGEARYKPSYTLKKMFLAGTFGRKSGKGFYSYSMRA
ncbi:MAG: hbd1 [Rhodocyclales bacterium]|nr:hbd1 [Rhodocyclales bacterium]MDB5888492.1 hbd1 [Rhodocyclales bacterium]